MTIRIDKGIPVPTRTTNNLSKYDEVRKIAAVMEIGDSFLIPAHFIEMRILKNGKRTLVISQNVWQIFKRLNLKYAARKNKEDDTFRLWRIE